MDDLLNIGNGERRIEGVFADGEIENATDPMWKGACSRWGWVSQTMTD
jgi:hypothetical protein